MFCSEWNSLVQLETFPKDQKSDNKSSVDCRAAVLILNTIASPKEGGYIFKPEQPLNRCPCFFFPAINLGKLS